jgi:hypothetical protein
MIVSLLKGGLGNMMFQISAGASIAKELGVDFSYTYEGWNCCTQYKIDEYPETIFKNIRKIDSPPRGWNPIYFRENGLLYQPIPRSTELVLDGYFQTEEHFKANDDYIRNLFDVPIIEEYKDYTFIHIRRGDYLKYSDVHSLMSDAYYTEALRLIIPDKVVILTDDKEWARQHPIFSRYKIPETKIDLEDLSIMKSCNSAIIANSTFGWWGAWLSNAKTVIAPKGWFGNSTPIDIVPSRWLQI